jgi:oligopeptide/dipeptide ABC transporter ATP-binding protein
VVRAVDGVSFTLRRGQIFGVVGESGCGKSTLGRLVLGLIKASAGQVLFKGLDITGLSRREWGGLRKSMQMVFQNPFASFNPRIRIYGALAEVCRYYKMDRAAARERILKTLDAIGLSGDVLFRWPGELSGGQLQRLAIARALMPDPELIVADEPLSALDVSVQAQLLNLLSDMRRRFSTAMIFISHDITAVEYLCDEVAVMYFGKILEQAAGGELFADPRHPYTAALIAAAPLPVFPGGSGDPPPSPSPDSPPGKGSRILLEGDPPSPGTEIPGCPFASRCPRVTEKCRREAPPLVEVRPGHLAACHLA